MSEKPRKTYMHQYSAHMYVHIRSSVFQVRFQPQNMSMSLTDLIALTSDYGAKSLL